MAVLAFLALLLGTVFWVLLPLTRKEDFRAGGTTTAGELKDLYALREVAYDTLRDLEFDFSMEKMAEGDYRELKTRYQAEAAEILRQIGILESRVEMESGTPLARPDGKPRR